MAFRVHARDRDTGKPTQICVPAFVKSPQDAADYVEKFPRSRGGTHPGFDLLSVEEFDPRQPEVVGKTVLTPEQPKAAEPQIQAAVVEGAAGVAK